ncbi:hypothetical protein [Mollivirus kamchatka]|nr:hypothetical protein [Mollivirus kamchatka]
MGETKAAFAVVGTGGDMAPGRLTKQSRASRKEADEAERGPKWTDGQTDGGTATKRKDFVDKQIGKPQILSWPQFCLGMASSASQLTEPRVGVRGSNDGQEAERARGGRAL